MTKKIKIKFLKDCCSTKQQFKKDSIIEIEINNDLPVGNFYHLKNLFKENKEEKYFEIMKEECESDTTNENQESDTTNNKKIRIK